MKKIISTLTLALVCATFAFAQQNEYEYIKTQYHADKKTLLMHYMMLTDSQAAKFWPIYNNYEKERGTLADSRFANLKTYADQYKTMTNEQADAMVNNYLDNNAKAAAIEKKYYGQVKKALGSKIAASWFQFEVYMDAAVHFEVLHSVPFLNEK
jgi:hypothetical protein